MRPTIAATPEPDPVPAEQPAEPDPRRKSTTESKAMSLRLNMDAWRQLKILAIEEGRTAHDILIDSLNGYFREHGKPPLA